MTILITGASGGLGREVARGLARAGSAHLILPVRDAHSGDALRSEIESLGCEKVSTPVLELASLSNVMTFIEDFRARGQPAGLQGLLFNAGRQSAHGLTFTADGFESTFAVNHLAHHALFRGLQDRLTPHRDGGLDFQWNARPQSAGGKSIRISRCAIPVQYPDGATLRRFGKRRQEIFRF